MSDKKRGFWMTLGKTCGCHQMKERSFHIKNKQMFVCSRCLGIIIGYLVLTPIMYLLKLHFGYFTILFMLPLIIDGSLQHFKVYESNNIRRLFTGLLAGYGFGITIASFITYIVKIII